VVDEGFCFLVGPAGLEPATLGLRRNSDCWNVCIIYRLTRLNRDYVIKYAIRFGHFADQNYLDTIKR